MPSLGSGMDVGRILEWYVQPGDEVERGQIVALVETDKANIDVEIFTDGVIAELLVEAGVKVPVGTPLARLADLGTEVATPAAKEGQPAVEPAAEVPAPTSLVTSPIVRRLAERTGVDLHAVHGTGRGGVITRHDVEEAAAAQRPTPPAPAAPAGDGHRASPYARRLAAERGLDLSEVAGSGPGGAVLAEDVEAAATTGVRPSPAAGPPPARTAPGEVAAPPAAAATTAPADTGPATDRGQAMRQAIARAMERSNREIPHYHLGETIDIESTLGWLAEVNADRPPAERLLSAVLFIKATALALRRSSDLNGYWVDGAFHPGDGIHVGVAINLRRGGLLAPAIRNADERSLDELMAALKDLVERTRAGGLRGSELTDPTITVSNLGDSGVDTIQGVITPPQVAFVGVGRITPRPWAVDGMLAVRRTVYLGLSADHRASDGHRGARVLTAIADHLRRPETL